MSESAQSGPTYALLHWMSSGSIKVHPYFLYVWKLIWHRLLKYHSWNTMIRYSCTVNNMITWLRMEPMHQQASNWTSSAGIFRFRLQKHWHSNFAYNFHNWHMIQYIPRNRHTVFALLCFVVVILWLIFPYPAGLPHWHCGNLTIAPVPAKQPWWIWINTSCEFIMNDCITTTKQSTTKPCAYFLGYTVVPRWLRDVECLS